MPLACTSPGTYSPRLRLTDLRPAFAVIEWSDFQRLAEGNADARLSDEELYDRAMAEGAESCPIEVADRLVAGESPVRVYRNHRGLTQNELSAAVGIHKMYLSQIETGRRVGSTKTLAALASVLNETIDDLTGAGKS